ncbi:MAG TPA: glycosyltransferase family 39 protein [Terriglobales bacterium]|nr:glycosyltransferase family 39 protein [Terriglobales bacterium]
MAIAPPPVIELRSPQVSPNAWPKLLRRHWLAWAAILLIFAFVYLGSLSSPAIFDDADATHAEAAREMVANNDWVTLHVDGIRYLEKPLLPYWLVATCYRVFGVSEWATRLPTAIAILLLMFLAADWARRAFGARASIYAALFVVTTIGYYLFSRILIPEALLALTIAGALYFAVLALDRGRASRLWYASYACLALAVLAKGLVAIIFVGGTLLAYLIVTGEWKRWREFHLVTGTLLFLLIAAPWHILAGVRNSGFFWFYFVNEHLLRFLGKRYPKDYNKLPAIAYWTLHFVWLFPWSLFLARVVENLRERAKQRVPSAWSFADRTRMICLVWSGLILVFFAISTNQEYYTFPAYLPLLLLAADALASDRLGSRWSKVAYAALTIMGTSAGIALIAGVWSSRHLPVPLDLGSVLADRQVADNTLAMSKFFDLTGPAFAGLRLPALLAAFALLVGPLAALLSYRRSPRVAVWTLATASAVFLFAAHIALVRFGPFMSSRILAGQVQQVIRPGDQVMIYGDQAYGSSLIFYLQRQVMLVNGRSTSLLWGSKYPDAPHIFLDDEDLLRAWQGSQRVFLFVPKEQQARAKSVLGKGAYLFAQVSGKEILSNRQ